MAEPAVAALLVSHHLPGFYFRVLEGGEVGAGDWNLQKLATFPYSGRAAQGSAIRASAD
jgi:hypothetical protein